jgi:membrane protease YdiL (CAAX protease family)
MLPLAAVFYAAMIAAAIGLNLFRGAPPVPLAMTPRLYPALAASLLMTVATLVFSAFGSRRWAWARELEETFRRLLGPLDLGTVLFLAFASGTAEELFFRGALQPALVSASGSGALGVALTTTAFAAIHTGPDPALRPWMGFAFALGLFLGAVTLLSGNVLPAIGCHIAINAVNLRRITKPIER